MSNLFCKRTVDLTNRMMLVSYVVKTEFKDSKRFGTCSRLELFEKKTEP